MFSAFQISALVEKQMVLLHHTSEWNGSRFSQGGSIVKTLNCVLKKTTNIPRVGLNPDRLEWCQSVHQSPRLSCSGVSGQECSLRLCL